SPEGIGMHRAFSVDGLVLARSEEFLLPSSLDPKRLELAGLDGLVAQIDDEGLAVAQGETILIPWNHVFQLLEGPDYSGCRELLSLPQDAGYVPALQSHHTLTDRDFSIVVADWFDPAGARIRNPKVCGAIIEAEKKFGLLSRPVWETLAAISRFQRRPDSER